MRAHGRKGSATATLSSPATRCAVPACSSQRNLRDHHLRGIHQGRVSCARGARRPTTSPGRSVSTRGVRRCSARAGTSTWPA